MDRRKITIWERINPDEGFMLMVMIALLAGSLAILATGLFWPKGPEDLLARVGMGTVFGIFSGGYIYGLWKKTRRPKCQ